MNRKAQQVLRVAQLRSALRTTMVSRRFFTSDDVWTMLEQAFGTVRITSAIGHLIRSEYQAGNIRPVALVESARVSTRGQHARIYLWESAVA